MLFAELSLMPFIVHSVAGLRKRKAPVGGETQNIDGLHGLAGTSPDRLVELHGTNSLVECQSCRWRGDPEPHFGVFPPQSQTAAVPVRVDS